MKDFYEIKNSIFSFYKQKPVLFWVIFVLLFLFIAGMIVLFIQSTPPKKIETIPEEKIELQMESFLPEEIQIEKDYYFSVETKDFWSEEEIKKYVQKVDEKSIKELEKANDSIIQEILGATR